MQGDMIAGEYGLSGGVLPMIRFRFLPSIKARKVQHILPFAKTLRIFWKQNLKLVIFAPSSSILNHKLLSQTYS